MSFSKNPKDLFKNINSLSEVLVEIVHSYIPISITMFLTKEEYLLKHHLIRNFIPRLKIEKYIRTMVIQDNEFVFKQLIIENSKRWLNMKNYYHKECIYSNYLIFLEAFAIDNQSMNCKNAIIHFLEQEGLSKNQHKKKAIRYIRWRT